MRECSVTVLCKHYMMAHEVPHLYFHDHPGLHLPLPAIPLALVADIAAVVHIVSIYHRRHLAMLLAGTSSLIGLPFLVIAPLLKKFSKDLSFPPQIPDGCQGNLPFLPLVFRLLFFRLIGVSSLTLMSIPSGPMGFWQNLVLLFTSSMRVTNCWP